MVNQIQKSFTGAGRAHLLAYIQTVFGLAVIIAFIAFGLFATVFDAFLW
jgi:hypothetical protein